MSNEQFVTLADPSPIPRWVSAYGNSQMIEEPTGNYIHISDHEEALRACEERVRGEQKVMDLVAIEALQNSTLKAARDAVAALSICTCPWPHDPDKGWCALNRALKAIDALRGEL